MSVRKITPEDLVNLDNSYTFEWMKERGYTGGGFFSDDAGATPLSNSGEMRARFTGDLYQVSVNGSAFQTIARGSSHIFNVLDHGADPTGVNDSTASIQATIEAALTANGMTLINGFARGGHIYIPGGTYKITSALSVGRSIGGTITGDSNTTTRIVWAGTAALIRWATSTSFTSGQTVNFHGSSYTAQSTGTTGTVGPTQFEAGQTSTDGGVSWLCNGIDVNSDMMLVRSYNQYAIKNIEFTSATGTAVNSANTTPICVIRSLSHGNALSPSGLILENILIDWTVSNTGLANQHDYGIYWDCFDGSNGQNNSEGYVHNVGINGSSIAAIGITGAQSQDHEIYRVVIENSNANGVMTQFGGSFCIRDSNVSATPNVGTCFVLGAPNDRIVIDHCISEDSARFVTSGGNPASPSLSGAPWPVTVRNCRFSCNGLFSDGRVIIVNNRGPFVVENCIFDGGTVIAGAPQIPVMYCPSSNGTLRAIVRDCAFTWHAEGTGAHTGTNTSPQNQSFISSSGGASGIVEERNVYLDSVHGNALFRAEAGVLTQIAYTVLGAWSASPGTYTSGQYVTHAGNTYKCVTTGTSSSTGPVGHSNIANPEIDGTAKWIYIGSTSDGTTLAQCFEVPVHSATSYSVTPFISALTGSTAAGITITKMVKQTWGFELTFSGAVTGSDTVVVNWVFQWV